MIDVGGLSGELADLAKIIGLLKDDGAFNAAWFNDPLVSLRTILSNPAQRRAMLRLLDALLPPRRGPGVPAGEIWHPLLNANAAGNVYLTVREAGDSVVVGVAGDFGTDGPPVAARIGVFIPLLAAGSTVTLLPGSDAGPLVARLSVVVNLLRGAGVGISLRAVSIEAQVRPSGVALRVVLEGLSLDGEPAVDKLLDPATLGADVPDLLAGLLKQIVAQDSVAAAAVQDAVGLLGLAENEIPAFPFVRVAEDPAAVQGWLNSLFEGVTPPIEAWLRHFAGLFRALFAIAPVVERIAATDSFSIPLVPLGSPQSQLRLAVARGNGKLRIGLALRLSDLIGGVRFVLEAGASLADIPLAGSARAQVLPEAFAHLRVTGDANTRLVPPGEATNVVPANNDLRVAAVVAGLRFDGAVLQPRLELQGVHFLGTSYPVLDLTHTDSVAAAASGVITTAIDAALGNGGVARRLAALAGLAPPRDPANPAQPLPGWPHSIDPVRLVTDPAGAIAAVHRAVLRDPAFGWNRIFSELVALLPGVPPAISGTGTLNDPWRATLGNSGALQLQLVACDAQADAAPAATRQLRLGLRLAAEAAPLRFDFTSDLLAFDLPASGAGQVGLLGAQRLRLSLEPAFVGKLFDDTISASVDAFFAELRWAPGEALAWQAGIANLRIDAAGEVISVPSIALPAVAGFDLANPAAAAALFGLTPTTLERLVSLLIAQAASALPGPVRELTALLGLHRFGNTLPVDWPQWIDAAAPGLSLTDPLAALRGWLQRLLTTVGADGRPHLARWITGLTQALASQVEPTLGAARAAAVDPLAQLQLQGAGTFDEPWSLPLPGADSAEAAQLLVWLDPAGAPTALASGIGTWIASATSFFDAVAALRALAIYDDTLRARLRGRETASVAEALDLLADLLERSDAVVPLASQQPQIDGWLLPDPITATHWDLPRSAAAIAEIGSRVDSIAGGPAAARVVLLLAPQLAGADPWAALLAAASTHGNKNPAALFALDDASIPNPLTFPLDSVAAVADWYVARLPDDDLPDWTRQSQLIARICDRLAQLRPGVGVTLVAHSTLGLAARHYAANHLARVAGLVTLGTPHIGANLPFLTDADLADAIRLLGPLAADLADTSLRAGVEHLQRAIDGYAPAASVGALPTRQPFPFAAFDPTGADIDLGSLPVVAIGATVHSDGLLAELKTAAQALATRIAAIVRPAPTHLGVGIALALDLGASTDIDRAADAHVRVDLLQIPLSAVPAAAPRPVNGLRFTARLYRRDSWLLGGASTLPAQLGGVDPRLAFIDVRLREVSIGLDAVRDGSTIRAQPTLLLTDAALHGPTLPVLRGDDPVAAGVLGELFQALSAGADLLGGPTARLLDAFTSLGLVGPDPHGGIGLLDDAWHALQSDAMAFLGERLPPLFESDTGWLGFAGPAAGPWVWSPGDVPIDLVVSREGTRGPWSAALRMRSETAVEEVSLAVGVSVGVTLPALAVTAAVSARLGALELDWQGGTLIVRAEPWLAGLTLLPPPAPADLQRELSRLWPRLLFSGAASAALSAVAPTLRIAGFERLLSDAGGFLQSVLARGDGTGLSVERVRDLIKLLSRALGLPIDGTLALPAGLHLSANGAGTAADPLRLSLDSTAPLAGVLGFALGVAIDPARHVTPHGTITLTLPLDGTWNQLGVRFGADASGLSLQLLPGNGVPAIQILPTFSGLGALRGAAEALLPRVLDELVTTLGLPQPLWLTRALAVAGAFELHDGAGGFTAHTAQMRALLDGSWFATFDTTKREAIAEAAVQLLQVIAGLPVTVARDGARVRLGLHLPVQLSGTVGIAVGFEGAIPSIGLFADNLQIAGVVQARLSLLARSDGVSCEGRVGASFAQIGVPLVPRIDFSGDTAAGGFRLSARPLAAGIGDAEAGPLQLQLAPSFAATLATGSVERLLTDWALPLVAGTLIQVARNEGLLSTPLWSGGPTLETVLTQAQLVTGSGVALRLANPLPRIDHMVFGAIKALATGVEIGIGDLKLKLVQESGRLGLGLSGLQKFSLGNKQIAVLFGAPKSWTQNVGGDAGTPEVADGLQLFVLRDNGTDLEVDVGIELSGIGVGLFGSDGRALLDDPSVRIGGVSAYLFMTVETKSGPPVQRLGGGLLLKEFGLPLGALTGGGGGGNPVVAALMSQGGSGGDARTPAPAIDVEVWFREDDRLHMRMGGESKALWIGVHSQFGPIYIDQVGVRLTSVDAGLLVDGGVSLAGFSAQVDDLSLIVPFRTAGDPATWKLDLKGLGLGFSQPGITIAGSLVKYEPPIEYNGMLLIKIGSIGAIAVGSYSVPQESNGDKYTSLAIFGGVFVPIGLTPIINITALGLGLGLNRRLVVPEDLNEIPNFFLIQALDRPEMIANDPLGALLRFRAAVPARRGSFWIAAGLRGTSFEIVHVTAVLYVALDRGVEVGLLGLARAALPADEAALVSVELALKVRFSTAEMLFSVQAQLTDNSWLLSRDCQLTGGFAFFMWFKKSQFLLTLGGYHPAFQKLPEYPDVPRLGYRWNLLGVIHIKGESYFALTNTCVMAGTLLEVTYGPDWLQLWFTAHADFLAQWDPFYFMADVGVAVGARLRVEVCFIGCVTISISVSVGATLHLEGPPLHGTVTVDLAVTTVTVPFGPDARSKPPPIDWPAFKLKFLQASDPATLPVGVQVSTGLLAPEPPGAPVAPGSEAQPWKLAAEWVFQSETRMPARSFAFVQDGAQVAWNPNGAARFGRFNVEAQTYDLDIGPMNAEEVTSCHRVFIDKRVANNWQRITAAELDPRRFFLEPRFGEVSEAAYRVFADLPPAAANTLPALLGLVVRGVATLRSTTPDVIPIAKLRDATNPRPLPFAQPEALIFVDVQIAGRAADRYVTIGDTLTHRQSLLAAAAVLSGSSGVFAENRVASGVIVSGLGPVATRALLERRSAAPLVAPLSTGLSMKPVDQDVAPTVLRPVAAAPVELERPRLRAVLQPQARATEAAPPTIRTTVSSEQRKGAFATVVVGRDLKRGIGVAGARLVFHAAASAPAATRFANAATSVRSPQIGGASGAPRAKAFAIAEKSAQGDGAIVRSGVTQLWDVPMAQPAIALSGDQAVRVTLLSRGGSVIADTEYAAGDELRVELPDNCAAVAITGLGRLGAARDGWRIPPGPGAVTAFAAPAGRSPATGWQSSDVGVQLNASTLLVRGAVLSLSEPAQVALHGQQLTQAVVPLAQAIGLDAAVEMRMSARITVLAVMLDAVSARLPGDDDVMLSLRNAIIDAHPVRAGGGQRAVLLFDVQADKEATGNGDVPIIVGAHAADDVRISGMVGLGGTAREWGERLNGGLPEDWVPDEALTPDGATRVRFVGAANTHPTEREPA